MLNFRRAALCLLAAKGKVWDHLVFRSLVFKKRYRRQKNKKKKKKDTNELFINDVGLLAKSFVQSSFVPYQSLNLSVRFYSNTTPPEAFSPPPGLLQVSLLELSAPEGTDFASFLGPGTMPGT